MHVELKSGRVPEGVTQRLGHWKAEDLQKFVYPISEYILEGLLPDDHYHVWLTLVRITELIYNTGRQGFTVEDREVLKKLIARHNILTEETEGLKSCVVTLHNLIHLVEDIERFGPPDNYWCYGFERAVKGYKQRSSNSKHLEYTYARAECRREFLKFRCNDGNSKVPSSVSPIASSVVRFCNVFYYNLCITVYMCACAHACIYIYIYI